MCIPLCITVINNTAQSSSDNIPSLPPHNHHSSDAVCHRRGGIIVTMKQLNSIMYAGIVNLQSSDISKTKVNQCLLCLPCFGLFSSFHAIFDVRRSQPIMRPCTVAYVITCCKPVQILVKTLISNSLQENLWYYKAELVILLHPPQKANKFNTQDNMCTNTHDSASNLLIHWGVTNWNRSPFNTRLWLH